MSDRIQFDSHVAKWALLNPSGKWLAGGTFRCESAGAGTSEIEGQVGGLTPQHHKNQCNLNACQRSLSMFYDSDLKIKLRHIHSEESEDGG